jgi:lipoprotein signal peptidase
VLRATAVLALALPLTAADLAWKHAAATPEWAYHARSFGWLVLCTALVGGLLALGRVPSRLVVLASGVLAGGVLGNLLSGAWNGLRVPNPIVVEGDRAVIAFNLADVFTLVGIIALVGAVSTLLIRHRHFLAAGPSHGRSSGSSDGAAEL